MKIYDIVSENKDLPKGNPVAKNLNKFNKPATHTDRKKAMKKGERKHKGTPIDEAPVGVLKQMGRKLGAKAAGAVGMKGTAAGLSGAAKTGDVARDLNVALKGYAGETGLNLKQLDAQDLAAFLKSKGFPTTPLANVTGALTPKQIDQALLQAAQEKAKASGAKAGSGVAGSTAASGKPAPAGGGITQKALDATSGPAPAGKAAPAAEPQAKPAAEPQAKPAAEPQAKPAAKPVSAAPTPKVGDTVTYVNAKGQKKQAQVNKILTTKDAQGDPQIQLTANGAEFAVDKKAIQSVEPAAAPSADAAPDPAIAKQIQTVQAEIKKLNAKQKQELVGMI